MIFIPGIFIELKVHSINLITNTHLFFLKKITFKNMICKKLILVSMIFQLINTGKITLENNIAVLSWEI